MGRRRGLHFSLWRDGGNVMAPSGDAFGLSPTARSFLAGVLDHLPALVALTCPSHLSYDRLRPSAWASSTVSWGFDNREAALRVASPFRGRERDSANAALEACDASSNPYLALGGLVLAGLDGLARGLELPEPAAHDPATLPDQRPLPADQLAALAELEADPVLMDGLGPWR